MMLSRHDEQDDGDPEASRLVEGTRIGRFVVLRDLEGQTLAVAAGSVAAICATDEGALLMLPGGRMIHVPRKLETVLGWLDGRG